MSSKTAPEADPVPDAPDPRAVPPVPGGAPGLGEEGVQIATLTGRPEGPVMAPPEPVREPTPADLARARFMDVTAGENPLDRVGDALADLRQALGHSLAEVKTATLIREDYLSNLEVMNVKAVPENYIPMYLSSYARFLGLDPAEVVHRYQMQCGALSEAPEVELDTTPRARLKEQVRWVSAGAAGLLGGLIVLMLGLQVFARPDDELKDFALADGEGAATVQTGKQVLSDPVQLARIDAGAVAPPQLRVLRKGWVEVRGADGTVFRDRVMAPGEVLTLRAGAGWTVTVHDGAAFEWVRGDEVIGPMGAGSVPVFSASVDQVLASHEEAKRLAREAAEKAANKAQRTVVVAPPR
jgi:hypothetical protein